MTVFTNVAMVWIVLLLFLRKCEGSPPPRRMEVVVTWPGVELQFPSAAARNAALASGSYAPANMSVWSILVFGQRMFLFCPNQFGGTYSTVNFVYLNELSLTVPPKLRPYSPTFNNNVLSVFRAAITCRDHYMYFVDDGKVRFGEDNVRRCAPRLFRVHMPSDKIELLYTLRPGDYNEASLFTNLVVDQCSLGNGVATVYIADLAQYGIVVIDLKNNTSHRLKHPYLGMDPFSAFLTTYAGDRYTFLADGVAALALTNHLPWSCDRTLYFASSGGRHVFNVSTETLRNKTLSSEMERFRVVGYKGNYSQSNNMVYDINSKVLFYATTQENTLYCWDTNKELTPLNQMPVMRDNMVFRTPNDLESDCDGTLWALANNWVGQVAKLRGGTSSPTGGRKIAVLRGKIRDLVAVCTKRTKN